MPFKVIPTTGMKIYQVNFIFSEGISSFGDYEIDELVDLSTEQSNTLDFVSTLTNDINPVEIEYDEPENDFPPGYDPNPAVEDEPTHPSPYSPY